jgi:hypothetical protein
MRTISQNSDHNIHLWTCRNKICTKKFLRIASFLIYNRFYYLKEIYGLSHWSLNSMPYNFLAIKWLKAWDYMYLVIYISERFMVLGCTLGCFLLNGLCFDKIISLYFWRPKLTTIDIGAKRKRLFCTCIKTIEKNTNM